MNEHRQALDDQALDWQIRLHAAPHSTRLRKAHQRWLQTSPSHQTSWAQVQQLWALTGQLQPATRDQWPIRRHWRGWLTIAAVVILALSLWWLPLTNDQLSGQQQLADGSIVWGTPSTRLQAHVDTRQRNVTLLAGKAFFDVAPDPNLPFMVQAGDTIVRVTGTSFTVDLDTAQVTIAVESGTVQVEQAEYRIPLAAGQQVRLASDSLLPPTATPIQGLVAPWRDQLLAARNQPIAELVAEVRPYTRLPILIRDPLLAASHVSGLFDLGNPQQALAEMVQPHGGSVRKIWPGILLIEGKEK